jgi:hypothetical protein
MLITLDSYRFSEGERLSYLSNQSPTLDWVRIVLVVWEKWARRCACLCPCNAGSPGIRPTTENCFLKFEEKPDRVGWIGAIFTNLPIKG